MKVDIAKEDLWWLREAVTRVIREMERAPNPSAFSKMPSVCRKFNRKLTRAIKKAKGHTMGGEFHEH